VSLSFLLSFFGVETHLFLAVKKRLHSERVVKAAHEALEGRVAEFDREKEAIDAVIAMFADVNG